MPSQNSRAPSFPGFSSPNGTIVPDEFFDELMPVLSHSELRVCLYIMRRTFGFKKTSDNISLSQMVAGITTTDGRVLDKGTGLSKAGVANGLKGLLTKGVIEAARNRSATRGNEPTTYRLRFKDEQKAAEPAHLEQPEPTPLVQNLDKGGVYPLDKPLSNRWTHNKQSLQTTDVSLSRLEGSDDEFSELDNDDTTESRQPSAGGVGRENRNGTPTAFRPLGEILKQRETTRLHQAEPDRGVSEIAPPTAAAPRRGSAAYGTTEEREKLYAYLRDFSVELGDEAQLSSSITQVLKIFHDAHIPIEHFDDHLYRARALTQEHSASITKRSGDPTRLSGKNKFPYFKKVVMNLVSPDGQGERRRAD